MKPFFIRTSLLAAFFLIAGALIYALVIPHLFTPSLIILLFFIFATANIVYAWLFSTLKKNRTFSATFMAVNFIKMFAYLIVVIGWAWIERENAKVILVNFLIMYFAFAVLEVVELVRLVKKKN